MRRHVKASLDQSDYGRLPLLDVFVLVGKEVSHDEGERSSPHGSLGVPFNTESKAQVNDFVAGLHSTRDIRHAHANLWDITSVGTLIRR